MHNNIQAFWGELVDTLPTVDSSNLTPGVIATSVVLAGVTVYYYNGNWVKAAPVGGTVVFKALNLINELAESGVTYTSEDVVAITKTAEGQLVWLENGSAGESGAGLLHILEEHAGDFAAKGIESNQIPEFLMKAVSQGQVVAYQGKGTGRPIYEVIYNGVNQYVAITIGSNGFIVGANPTTLP